MSVIRLLFFCQIIMCTFEIQQFDNHFCLLFQKAKKPNFDDISFEIRPEVDKSAVSGSPATVTTTIPTKNNDKNNPESTATALSNNTSATAAGKDSKDKIRLNKPMVDLGFTFL